MTGRDWSPEIEAFLSLWHGPERLDGKQYHARPYWMTATVAHLAANGGGMVAAVLEILAADTNHRRHPLPVSWRTQANVAARLGKPRQRVAEAVRWLRQTGIVRHPTDAEWLRLEGAPGVFGRLKKYPKPEAVFVLAVPSEWRWDRIPEPETLRASMVPEDKRSAKHSGQALPELEPSRPTERAPDPAQSAEQNRADRAWQACRQDGAKLAGYLNGGWMLEDD